MPFDSPIAAPAGYLPGEVIAFASAEERAVLVSRAAPLPVAMATVPATAAPLTGTTATSGMIGPFMPELARAVMLTLTGTWSGTVALLRSADGGATKPPATLGGTALSWTGAINEPVWVETEAGVTLWLQVTRAAGTLTYRLAQ